MGEIVQLYRKFLKNECTKEELLVLFEYINSNDFLEFIPNELELHTEFQLPESTKILEHIKTIVEDNKSV